MFAVTTFYKFIDLSSDRIEQIKCLLNGVASELDVRGLLLLAPEGCNATLAVPAGKLQIFKSRLLEVPEFSGLIFKDSASEQAPFRRFKIDVRPEIVTLKADGCKPASSQNNHLSPDEWQRILEAEEDFVLIDTRNFYETELGMFHGAVDLKLEKFSDFPEAVEKLGIEKDRKVLMYCTGGIRCEKAILSMQSAGYSKVYQLEGGILKYLEQYPKQKFNGECFVFDHRVAVDQELAPSKKFKLCPHCGNPANTPLDCEECGAGTMICASCHAESHRNSCSKNCAYHLQRKAAKGLQSGA